MTTPGPRVCSVCGGNDEVRRDTVQLISVGPSHTEKMPNLMYVYLSHTTDLCSVCRKAMIQRVLDSLGGPTDGDATPGE